VTTVVRRLIELGFGAVLLFALNFAVMHGNDAWHHWLQSVAFVLLIFDVVAAIYLALRFEKNRAIQVAGLLIHLALAGFMGWSAWQSMNVD
jgi:hypothetical protein